MKIKEKVLDDFTHRNQYDNWKQVIKDKQSMTFEAKEFEEEIDLVLAEVGKQIDKDIALWSRHGDTLTEPLKELKKEIGI